MSKIITMKFFNKKIKWNISLLIILILLASSVIALLSINQIKHLLSYWNATFNYFRAYYLAKAWTELWLTEVYNRENWFNHQINTWDSIVKDNLIEAYSWFNPYFNVDINSNFEYLTNDIRYNSECNNENKMTLEKWEGIMIALFKDTTKDTKNILSWWYTLIEATDNQVVKELTFYSQNIENDITFGLFIFDDKNSSMTNLFVEKWRDLNKFINKHIGSYKNNWRAYLTIKNSWDKEISFCIKWKWEIPYHDSLITVRWNYWDIEVWLESVVKKSTPSWSLDIIWDQ